MLPREKAAKQQPKAIQSLSKARMIQKHLSCLLLAMHCSHVQRCLATPASAVLVVGWHLHGLVDGGEVLGIQQKGQDLGKYGGKYGEGGRHWGRHGGV